MNNLLRRFIKFNILPNKKADKIFLVGLFVLMFSLKLHNHANGWEACTARIFYKRTKCIERLIRRIWLPVFGFDAAVGVALERKRGRRWIFAVVEILYVEVQIQRPFLEVPFFVHAHI